MKKSLYTTTLDRTQGYGWGERNVSQYAKQFSSALSKGCSKAAQNFFATPEMITDDTIAFQTSDYDVAKNITDLSPQEREELDAKIEAICDEIESFRQSLLNSGKNNEINTAEAMDAIFKVPENDAIWSVDGEPVIAPWGVDSKENIDLRNIKAPKKPDSIPPIPKPDLDPKPDPGKKRLLLATLLILSGIASLVYFFGEQIACSQGWISCTAPIAMDDSVTFPHDSNTIDINLTDNDSDPDGGALKVTQCDTSVAILNDNEIQFARPNVNSSKPITFNCTIADEDNQTANSQVTVNFEATPNTAPKGRAISVFLPLGQQSVEVDVLSVVIDTDANDTLKITSCGSPASLTNNKVIYTRQLNLKKLVDDFSCEIVDVAGAKTTVPVTVNIESSGNKPPIGSPLSVVLPLDEKSINVDVLSAITDADVGDVHTVLSCTPPGRLSNGVVTYARPVDEKLLSESFICTVADAKGSTALVPVTANIEPSRCTPVDVEVPVKVIFGTDWSGSMGTSGGIGEARDYLRSGLLDFSRNVPKNVSAEIGFMISQISSSTDGDYITQHSIKPRDSNFGNFLNGLGGDAPDFKHYQKWLTDELLVAKNKGYGRITIVTITDAGDNPGNYKSDEMQKLYESLGTPVEHIVILLVQTNQIDEYKKMTWPKNSAANFVLLDTNVKREQLPQHLLEAANVVTRRDCL